MEEKTWKNNLANLNYLYRSWEEPKKNQEEIRKTEKAMGNNLLPIYEMGIETGVTGLYRADERDWNKRLLLREAYEEKDSIEPLIPNRPDSAFLLADLLKVGEYSLLNYLSTYIPLKP